MSIIPVVPVPFLATLETNASLWVIPEIKEQFCWNCDVNSLGWTDSELCTHWLRVLPSERDFLASCRGKQPPSINFAVQPLQTLGLWPAAHGKRGNIPTIARRTQLSLSPSDIGSDGDKERQGTAEGGGSTEEAESEVGSTSVGTPSSVHDGFPLPPDTEETTLGPSGPVTGGEEPASEPADDEKCNRGGDRAVIQKVRRRTNPPPIRATDRQTTDFPDPTAMWQAILDSGKMDVDALERMIPSSQRALVPKGSRRTDKAWKCRLRLQVPLDGDAYWGHENQGRCTISTKDIYARHIVHHHLGIGRPPVGRDILQQVADRMSRC